MTRTSRRVLLALLASTAACGKVVPPPADPEPEVAGVEPQQTLPAPRPEPGAPSALRMAWRRQTPPFVRAMALQADRVALLSSEALSIYQLSNGATRASVKSCAGAIALGFVSGDRLAVVCPNTVEIYAVDDLQRTSSHPLDDTAHMARVAGDVVAVAVEHGGVRLFELDGWRERRRLAIDRPVTALALSSDGARVAVGLEQGDVVVAVGDEPPARATVMQTLEVEALALSVDGVQIFASAGAAAKVWPSGLRSEPQRLRTVAGVHDAAWLAKRELITSGREGLLVLDLDSGSAKSLPGYVEGVSPVMALAAHDEVLCIAERDGQLSCMSRGRLGASKHMVLADRPGGPDGEAVAGRVVTLERTQLSVRLLEGSAFPAVDSGVSVQRYVERRVGKLDDARWLELAAGKVVEIDEGRVRVRLDGGVKPLVGVKDPFAPGTPVRLVWGP